MVKREIFHGESVGFRMKYSSEFSFHVGKTYKNSMEISWDSMESTWNPTESPMSFRMFFPTWREFYGVFCR